MRKRTTIIAKAAIAAAYLFGCVSASLFTVYLFSGPFNLVILDVSMPVALGIDVILCLLFFVQHSVMVRRSFRAWLVRLVPEYLHQAIYTVSSGVVLLGFLLFWQSTGPSLANLEGLPRLLVRGFFFVAILGVVWGVRALGSFDAFGIRPIKAFLRGRDLVDPPLTIRGPYRWVRHPLYTFVLLMLWCFPDYTADRLLFNATWTCWVFLGTVLEERDLVSAFGDPYRQYQQTVPMLIPWRLPK